MNSVSKRHSKSQVFARCIVDLAVSDHNLPVTSITPDTLSSLADEALSRHPDVCDMRFRGMAMCRILVYQRYCHRQSVARQLLKERLL